MKISELEIGKKYQCNATGEIGTVKDIVEGIQTNVVYIVNGKLGKCNISRFVNCWFPI